MSLSSYNSRRLFLFNHNHQCYYCGCVINPDTKYESDSACINLLVPVRFGGRRTPTNMVASCYTCCVVIKRDMDTRGMSIAQLRGILNRQRRDLGFAYNSVYAGGEPQAAPQEPQALTPPPQAAAHTNTIPEEEAEYQRLLAVMAELDREAKR